MYKLQGEKEENRPIVRHEGVNKDSLEAAKEKLLNEKRVNRASLVRAGFTLSGIVKHLGSDKKEINKVCRDAGIGSTEKNQLIAIAQVKEFSSPIYDQKLPNSIGPLYELCRHADLIQLMGDTEFLEPTLTTSAIKKFARLYAKDKGESVRNQYEDQRRVFDAENPIATRPNSVKFQFKPDVDSLVYSDPTKKVIELRIDPTKYTDVAALEAAVSELKKALDKAELGEHVTAVDKSDAKARANWMDKPATTSMTQEEKEKKALLEKIDKAKVRATKALAMLKLTMDSKDTGLGEDDQKKVLTQWLGKSAAQVLQEHDPENAIHKHIKRLDDKFYDLTDKQIQKAKEAADPLHGKTITLELEPKAAE